MAVATTYPGVYIQEVPSGVRTIAGVSTSVTMFVGAAGMGPINTPIRLFSNTDYVRTFGSDSTVSDVPRQVKLFFLNGGTDCYMMRIAQNAAPATMELQGADTLSKMRLTARQEGAAGDRIRARVTYDAANGEAEFNIRLWRAEPLASGGTVVADEEEFRNLSMNPASPTFAPDILTQQSKLVTADDTSLPPGVPGFSQAGRPIPYTDANQATLDAHLDDLCVSHGVLAIGVGGTPPTAIPSLAGVPALVAAAAPGSTAALISEYEAQLTAEINAGIAATGEVVAVTLEPGPTPRAAEGDNSVLLRISSGNPDRDVRIVPASDPGDMAVFALLGSGQGGLEVSAFEANRPAANGIALDPLGGNMITLMGEQQDAITEIILPERQADGSFADSAPILVDLETSAPGDPIYHADAADYPAEATGGYRIALERIRDAINGHREANPANFPWVATVSGVRLLIQPDGEDTDLFTGAISTNDAGGAGSGFDLGGTTIPNVKNAMLGAAGIAGFQTPGAAGNDGNPPTLAEYEAAFPIIDREVDIFNIMVLPPTHGSALDMSNVSGPASVFCQRRRAFLVMDPPIDWTTAQGASTAVSALKIGKVKDHAAVFFPRLRISEGGRNHYVGPGGAIAGLMARTDSNRGVWKAPAGTGADLRGINGIEYPLSDAENGILNPRAINVIRSFPNGIVNWGGRTLEGDDTDASEYKYISTRRLALYIEESLYRGLKWTVFEPNDEPLWAQIRLNAGAFMHGLFRQGAFQGQVKNDAYFVKCDAETTTQTDRNLGRVHVWIGFAPLKPAEFVVLYLQQIAGQIES
ncbi:MAG: phage tail sheath C-terminal domain-containing protein [Sulfitobacter sp.]|uniref:phage tail sheath family protein n=1 Tax=Sulfitobacter sp. TaxID=1903071 RepID=UPI0032984FA2